MMLVEDRALLDAFRRGEKPALERVYRGFAPAVAAFLRAGFEFQSGGRRCQFKGTASHFDLEDRLADAFERAFSEAARASYDGLSSYKRYVVTIARNLVIDDYRKKASSLVDFAIVDVADERRPAVEVVSPRVQPGGRPLVDAEAVEITTLMRTFIDRLPDREREVYELRFVQGLEHTDISAATGLSDSMVKTSEKRIRKGLFGYMRERGYLSGYEQKPSGWLRLLRRAR